MRRICTFFILGSFLFALGNSTPSQEPLKPGRLPKEVQDALKPGLTLQFFGKDSAQPLDARRSRLAAFYLPANSAPSPLLEGGGWTSPAPLSVTRSGTWAYANPSHGARYLAIPEGEGIRVDRLGPLGCLSRVSTDAGPALLPPAGGQDRGPQRGRLPRHLRADLAWLVPGRVVHDRAQRDTSADRWGLDTAMRWRMMPFVVPPRASRQAGWHE